MVDSSAPVATSSAVFASQPQRSLAGEERSKGTGSETEEKCEVKVYQIGSEQVEMQKDKVKRRTKGAEYIISNVMSDFCPFKFVRKVFV